MAPRQFGRCQPGEQCPADVVVACLAPIADNSRSIECRFGTQAFDLLFGVLSLLDDLHVLLLWPCIS